MEVMKTLRKRWTITLVLLVLTIAATGGAFKALPPSYQAKANVILLPSTTVAKTTGGNPFLAFDSTLNEAADVIRYEVTDTRTGLALQAAGYTQGYTITDAIDTAAPVLLITVTGKNSAAVENTLTGVTNEISTKLAAEQTDLTAENKIRSEVITFSPQPTAVSSKKLRSVLVVLAVGILLTFAVPLTVDAAATRRRRRDDSHPVQDTGRQQASEDDDERVSAYQMQEADYGPRARDYHYGNGAAPRPMGERSSNDVPASATRRPRALSRDSRRGSGANGGSTRGAFAPRDQARSSSVEDRPYQHIARDSKPPQGPDAAKHQEREARGHREVERVERAVADKHDRARGRHALPEMTRFRIGGHPASGTRQAPSGDECQQEHEGADETYLDDRVQILIVGKEIYVGHEYTEAHAKQRMRRNEWCRIGESLGA
jgi:capsular polysaccharide biosynthesis protein